MHGVCFKTTKKEPSKSRTVFTCACALQILIKVITILNMQYFCILQAIQNWSRGRPGNEDRTSTLTFVSQLGIAKLPVGIYVIAYNSI